MGRTRAELEELLTAADLALYQAVVEIDGPWWGAREAAHLRQIAAVTSRAAGADVQPEDFEIEWRVGKGPDQGEGEQPGPNLLPAVDGMRMMAAAAGLTLTEEPAS